MSSSPSPSSAASSASNQNVTADDNNTQTSDAPNANTPQSKPWPPGKKDFIECESGEQTDEKKELAALAIDLLLLMEQEKLCDIAKGSRSGQQWRSAYDTIFKDGGLFAGYKEWQSQTPWNTKLKPLCWGIIDHFSTAYDERGEREATTLEELAKTLSIKKNAADRNKAEDKDLTYARRVQNELVEKDMGFRSNGNGVESPSGVIPDSGYREGLAALGRQSTSVTETAAISNSAAAAAASVAGKTFDASRSRSAFEGNLANAAGKGSSAIPMSVRKARQMDQHQLNDSLSGALSSSTKEFAEAIKAYMSPHMSPPASKRQKTGKEVQEEILLVIEEIKGYTAINSGGEFNDELKSARARLKDLQQQRRDIDSDSVISLA